MHLDISAALGKNVGIQPAKIFILLYPLLVCADRQIVVEIQYTNKTLNRTLHTAFKVHKMETGYLY